MSLGQLIQTSKVPPTSWPTSTACTLIPSLHVLILKINYVAFNYITSQDSLAQPEGQSRLLLLPTPSSINISLFWGTLRWQHKLPPFSLWVSNLRVALTLLESNISTFLFQLLFSLCLFYEHTFWDWVNLKSLSVVHLLSNSSSASWNLQIISSFKQLGFFPSSEYISRFPRLSARSSFTSTSIIPAVLCPFQSPDVHLMLQCPTSVGQGSLQQCR